MMRGVRAMVTVHGDPWCTMVGPGTMGVHDPSERPRASEPRCERRDGIALRAAAGDDGPWRRPLVSFFWQPPFPLHRLVPCCCILARSLAAWNRHMRSEGQEFFLLLVLLLSPILLALVIGSVLTFRQS